MALSISPSLLQKDTFFLHNSAVKRDRSANVRTPLAERFGGANPYPYLHVIIDFMSKKQGRSATSPCTGKGEKTVGWQGQVRGPF